MTCLGCCAALMALLFVFGVMNLVWVAALALIVLAEKVFPIGPRIGAAIGVALADRRTRSGARRSAAGLSQGRAPLTRVTELLASNADHSVVEFDKWEAAHFREHKLDKEVDFGSAFARTPYEANSSGSESLPQGLTTSLS